MLNRVGKLKQLQTVNQENIEGEYVEIRLVPLSQIEKLDGILWGKNSKKHDIDKILESIERYGFVDVAKWDKNLNDSKGGIVFGNGRTEAVITGLIAARDEGREPPRGIPIDKTTGEWCIPMKFGVDCRSEVEAMALAIDHNNLTMAGFEDSEIARLWEGEGYLAVLSEIAEAGVVPITVDEGAIADMLASLEMPDDGDWRNAAGNIPTGDKIPFKVVNNSTFHIGVYYQGNLEGAMQFGHCLDKRKIQGLVSGTGWNEFIELNRMAFSDRLPRNSESRAIAIALRILKKHAPQIKWVISFADACQCGDGTIYRASGFILTIAVHLFSRSRLPPKFNGAGDTLW